MRVWTLLMRMCAAYVLRVCGCAGPVCANACGNPTFQLLDIFLLCCVLLLQLYVSCLYCTVPQALKFSLLSRPRTEHQFVRACACVLCLL